MVSSFSTFFHFSHDVNRVSLYLIPTQLIQSNLFCFSLYPISHHITFVFSKPALTTNTLFPPKNQFLLLFVFCLNLHQQHFLLPIFLCLYHLHLPLPCASFWFSNSSFSYSSSSSFFSLFRFPDLQVSFLFLFLLEIEELEEEEQRLGLRRR